MRTSNRAPPASERSTEIVPSWCSAIHFAIARPRPVPPAGAPGARQKRSKTRGRSSGATPGPESSTATRRRSGVGPDEDADGATARAVADRVVDEDRDELAQARRVADRRRRRGIDLEPHAGRGGRLRERGCRVGGDVVEVQRHPLERDGAGVGAGEEQQVVDQRGQVLDLGVDVDEGVADLVHGSVAVLAQVVHGSPDHGQRRAQLVARVGGELALATERDALAGERFADRHQRAARVDRAEADRHEHDHEATDERARRGAR